MPAMLGCGLFNVDRKTKIDQNSQFFMFISQNRRGKGVLAEKCVLTEMTIFVCDLVYFNEIS